MSPMPKREGCKLNRRSSLRAIESPWSLHIDAAEEE
jgi:hypothetical protein